MQKTQSMTVDHLIDQEEKKAAQLMLADHRLRNLLDILMDDPIFSILEVSPEEEKQLRQNIDSALCQMIDMQKKKIKRRIHTAEGRQIRQSIRQPQNKPTL